MRLGKPREQQNPHAEYNPRLTVSQPGYNENQEYRRNSNYSSGHHHPPSFARTSSNQRNGNHSSIQPFLQHKKEKIQVRPRIPSKEQSKKDLQDYGSPKDSKESLDIQRRTKHLQRLPMNVAANLTSLDNKLRGSRSNINHSHQSSSEKINPQAEE